MDKKTVEELEREINAEKLNLTSKDNNKNRLRVKEYLNANYPDIVVYFSVDKTAGRVEVEKVIGRAEADAQAAKRMEDEAARRAEHLAKQRFFDRAKTRSGNDALYNSIEKKLKKMGYVARGVTIHRSRSIVSTLSFYVEDAEHNVSIKISDHNTIGQQMIYNDTVFLDLHDYKCAHDLWADVRKILDAI